MRRSLLSVLALLAVLCAAVDGSAQGLLPRRPLDPGPATAPPIPPDQAGRSATGPLWRLTIKLVDEVRGRATARGTVVSRSGADLSALHAAAAGRGLAFEPAIALPEEDLAAFEARAAARSGRAQPDLAGILTVLVPGGEDDPARLEAAGGLLEALDVVEYAHVSALGAPPPGDIGPPTPDLTPNQDYRGPDPGLDVDYAVSLGLTGAGVRLADCEYGWVLDHEDLADVGVQTEPGQTVDPQVAALGWDCHGTAVLGETSAPGNGYGVTGIAPGAEVAAYTEWSVEQGLRRLTAVTNAIADSEPGDVVLLEMQASGATGFGPAELDPSIWAVCKAGTDAGVVVVGAAGNGSQDLDAPDYAAYMGLGDSGAILVGAGTSDGSHDALGFSTFGSRVDVQGWGENVFSTGYGDFEYGGDGGDKRQHYTEVFSGTSSASPFVAAVCCLVQERSLAINGVPLEPGVLRQLLKDTGIPQGSGGTIGPFPDLQAALDGVPDVDGDAWVDLGGGLAGTPGVPVQTATGTLLAGSTFSFEVTNARIGSPAWQVVGFSSIDAPFKGGILVPALDLLLGPLVTSLGGVVGTSGSFPPGQPSGVDLYSQWWIIDPAGPVGWSATNAVAGTTP